MNNHWMKIGLLALSAAVVLPATAQSRKKARTGAKKVTTAIMAKEAPVKEGYYRIKGTFPKDASVAKVYLVEGTDAVDSARVVGGTFTFERPVATADVVVRLSSDDRKYRLTVIPEAGTIEAPMEAETAKGTPLNNKWGELVAENEQFSAPYIKEIGAIRKDAALSSDAREAKQDSVYSAYAKAVRPKLLSTLREHANDGLGYYALTEIFQLPDLTLEEAESYLAGTGDKLRNNAAVTNQMNLLKAQDGTKAGRPFIDFAGVDDSNKSVRLSDYVGKGHYVLVDFWASWCGPCRREIQHLKKVRDAYTDKGLVILGTVVWDEMPDHLQAMKDLQITWPQIFNRDEPTKLYGITGIPQVILFAPDGKIVARDLRGQAINNLLDKILEQTQGKL